MHAGSPHACVTGNHGGRTTLEWAEQIMVDAVPRRSSTGNVRPRSMSAGPPRSSAAAMGTASTWALRALNLARPWRSSSNCSSNVQHSVSGVYGMSSADKDERAARWNMHQLTSMEFDAPAATGLERARQLSSSGAPAYGVYLPEGATAVAHPGISPNGQVYTATYKSQYSFLEEAERRSPPSPEFLRGEQSLNTDPRPVNPALAPASRGHERYGTPSTEHKAASPLIAEPPTPLEARVAIAPDTANAMADAAPSVPSSARHFEVWDPDAAGADLATSAAATSAAATSAAATSAAATSAAATSAAATADAATVDVAAADAAAPAAPALAPALLSAHSRSRSSTVMRAAAPWEHADASDAVAEHSSAMRVWLQRQGTSGTLPATAVYGVKLDAEPPGTRAGVLCSAPDLGDGALLTRSAPQHIGAHPSRSRPGSRPASGLLKMAADWAAEEEIDEESDSNRAASGAEASDSDRAASGEAGAQAAARCVQLRSQSERMGLRVTEECLSLEDSLGTTQQVAPSIRRRHSMPALNVPATGVNILALASARARLLKVADSPVGPQEPPKRRHSLPDPSGLGGFLEVAVKPALKLPPSPPPRKRSVPDPSGSSRLLEATVLSAVGSATRLSEALAASIVADALDENRAQADFAADDDDPALGRALESGRGGPGRRVSLDMALGDEEGGGGIVLGGEEPTALEVGGEEPTAVDVGGEEPTAVDVGGEEPTAVEVGGEEPTALEIGGEEPTAVEVGGGEDVSETRVRSGRPSKKRRQRTDALAEALEEVANAAAYSEALHGSPGAKVVSRAAAEAATAEEGEAEAEAGAAGITASTLAAARSRLVSIGAAAEAGGVMAELSSLAEADLARSYVIRGDPSFADDAAGRETRRASRISWEADEEQPTWLAQAEVECRRDSGSLPATPQSPRTPPDVEAHDPPVPVPVPPSSHPPPMFSSLLRSLSAKAPSTPMVAMAARAPSARPPSASTLGAASWTDLSTAASSPGRAAEAEAEQERDEQAQLAAYECHRKGLDANERADTPSAVSHFLQAVAWQPRKASHVLSAANMMLKLTPPWTTQAIELYERAQALPLKESEANMARSKRALAVAMQIGARHFEAAAEGVRQAEAAAAAVVVLEEVAARNAASASATAADEAAAEMVVEAVAEHAAAEDVAEATRSKMPPPLAMLHSLHETSQRFFGLRPQAPQIDERASTIEAPPPPPSLRTARKAAPAAQVVAHPTVANVGPVTVAAATPAPPAPAPIPPQPLDCPGVAKEPPLAKHGGVLHSSQSHDGAHDGPPLTPSPTEQHQGGLDDAITCVQPRVRSHASFVHMPVLEALRQPDATAQALGKGQPLPKRAVRENGCGGQVDIGGWLDVLCGRPPPAPESAGPAPWERWASAA